MANGLSPASSYLQTPQPPQDQGGQGALSGWAGILGSGIATIAGVASGNDYLVGFGGGAADSYRKSYEEFNSNLMAEQRANRLADADMMRQQHFAQFQRDLTAKDREFEQGLAREEMDLRVSQENRLGEQSALQGQLTQLQIDEVKKSPEERAKEQVLIEEIVANAARARSKSEQAQQIAELKELGATDKLLQLVKLQHAGLDISKFLNKDKKGPELGSKEFKDLTDEIHASYMANKPPEYSKILEANGKESADKYLRERAATDARELGNIYEIGGGGGGSLDVSSFFNAPSAAPEAAPQGAGQEALQNLITSMEKDLANGVETPESLLAEASTPRERDAAEQAIANTQSSSAPEPGALSGRNRRNSNVRQGAIAPSELVGRGVTTRGSRQRRE